MDRKGGKGKGHIISFRARAIRARITLPTGWEKNVRNLGTGSKRKGNRMRTKGKQCIKEEKTVVYGRESNGLARRKYLLSKNIFSFFNPRKFFL